jgi:hypothetical protein
MAGYSNTSLLKKPGIQDDAKVLLINQPKNYFELIEKDISSQMSKGNQVPDFIHLFATSNKEFEKHFFKLKPFGPK